MSDVIIKITENRNPANIIIAKTNQTNIQVQQKGIKGDPGSSANSVVGEIPAGLLNGSNATFTTANPFVAGTLEVFVNGLRQTIIADFNTSGNNTIQLTYSPNSSEVITVNYIKL
jgi:hypothetical protein